MNVGDCYRSKFSDNVCLIITKIDAKNAYYRFFDGIFSNWLFDDFIQSRFEFNQKLTDEHLIKSIIK